ncbi:DUF4160 domain-containing protein [Spirosoma utsteinense]|uniref:DUF4160 domain-containing protein n=1 Tax=Spirosoma utsteinense TaxID=2585773 RepID=UPI001643FECA|nr:DUF4160 domain-containing protein [Spirosoma utsteinense]MBC3789304.1 hypothetical protein [Spirosoma utsteinense]
MASYQLSKHIRVSITGREHNPPHVHVYFGGKVARVCIQDGSLLSGDPMPARVSATVLTGRALKVDIKLEKEMVNQQPNHRVVH